MLSRRLRQVLGSYFLCVGVIAFAVPDSYVCRWLFRESSEWLLMTAAAIGVLGAVLILVLDLYTWWDYKIFVIREKDEEWDEESEIIVNIRGRKALDLYFRTLPWGYYVLDKEENVIFGYENFLSGETYFRRRLRREESAFFFDEPTAEDQLELSIDSKFPDFSNFVRRFYTPNIVLEGSPQYSLAFKFDLSLTCENTWILGELKPHSDLAEAARIFSMKFSRLMDSLPNLYVHLIGETYDKVSLERLKEFGHVQVWLVIVADIWNEEEEESKLDIRALFSELKMLNGLMKKVIICTRDSEESAYIVQKEFGA